MNRFNRHIVVLTIVSILFLLSSCGSNKKYYRVHNNEPRLSTLGFSIEPPPGDDWYETHRDKSLIYLKKTDPNKYSLQTIATELNLSNTVQPKDKFVEYVHDKKLQSMKGAKHKNARLDYSLDNKHAALCVKYAFQYEDHNYKNLKKNEFVIIKSNGLICKHPQIPSNGIEISYMEKRLSSACHQSFLKEGEMFINSLAFHAATN